MEFYKIIQKDLDIDFIKQRLRLDNLDQYCDFINEIINSQENRAEIYCNWGLFNVQRELLKKGIRISLLNCPNALTFTITKEEQGIVVHCTINTMDADQDFIDSIELFLSDLEKGITQFKL